MKNDFVWENNAILTKNYVFEKFSNFQVEAEKLIFQTKWVVLHQNSLRNSILIKLKYCLSILEILDFALLRYPKKLVNELLQDFHLTVRHLAEVFGAKSTHFDVIVIRKMIFQALTKNF